MGSYEDRCFSYTKLNEMIECLAFRRKEAYI